MGSKWGQEKIRKMKKTHFMKKNIIFLKKTVSVDCLFSFLFDLKGGIYMGTARSYEERIEDLKRRQEQLKEQEKDLKKKVAKEERKKRTRRLIEIGGTVQSVLGRPLEDEDKDRLYRFLMMQERNGNYFTKAMSKKYEVEDKN